MRFLVDECTGPGVAKFLRDLGHEVFSVFDEARGSTDDEILLLAWEQGWIVITNDKDFGEKVFRDRRLHHGIVLLRTRNETTAAKIERLGQLLESNSERLPGAFTVVTESVTRIQGP